MVQPLLASLLYYLITINALWQEQSDLIPRKSGDRAIAVKTNMQKAFGGKHQLQKIEYITYTLSRSAYQDGDTVVTKQLWYMHLQQPLVVRLDVSNTDTLVFSTTSYSPEQDTTQQARAIYEGLLRARFFNFLYLLTTPDADFTYLKQSTYRKRRVDIIRVTSRQHASWSLDLFVDKKGKVVTSSTIHPSSGRYERFADEFAYEKVAYGIVFPLQYKVVQQDKQLAEGIFSEIQVNKLPSFWEKQLKRLGTRP